MAAPVAASAAIRVLNSTDVVVSKCIIHSAWQVDNSAIGELISAYNSVMTVSGCSSDGLNNSYSNYLAFISVDGAGEYNLFTNTFQNLHSNNGTVYGIKSYGKINKAKNSGNIYDPRFNGSVLVRDRFRYGRFTNNSDGCAQ